MAEPTSTTAASVSLAVLLIGVLGPTAGPWIAIIAGACGGVLWPLSGADTPTGWAALMLATRCVGTSIVLTGIIAGYIERTYQVPINESLAGVALIISALGNGWRPIFAGVGDLLRATVPGGRGK
jgi:hypothetical protein